MPSSADTMESGWAADEAVLIKVHTQKQTMLLAVECAFIQMRIKLNSTCYFL
jgi:hypothetical protein